MVCRVVRCFPLREAVYLMLLGLWKTKKKTKDCGDVIIMTKVYHNKGLWRSERSSEGMKRYEGEILGCRWCTKWRIAGSYSGLTGKWSMSPTAFWCGISCNSELSEWKGSPAGSQKTFDLPVDLHSNPHQWPWALGRDGKNRTAGISSWNEFQR